MRRRFLGGQKQPKQQQSSAPAKPKGGLFRKAAASPQPASAQGIDTTTGQVAINRRSFTTVDGPIGGRTVAAAADYSLFLAENKYATIGGPGTRSKWPLRGGTSEKALNGVGRPCPSAGGTGRPRSMGAAQMGVKCGSSNGTTAETAFCAAAAGGSIRSGRGEILPQNCAKIFLVVILFFLSIRFIVCVCSSRHHPCFIARLLIGLPLSRFATASTACSRKSVANERQTAAAAGRW